MKKEFKVIDFHTHIGHDAHNLRFNLIPSQHSFNSLLDKMSLNGIDKAVVFPFPSARANFKSEFTWYDYENEYVLNAFSTAGEKFIPFAAVNPKQLKSIELVNKLTGLHPIKGIKIAHEEQLGFSIDKLIGNPLMKVLIDRNLPLLLHIGTGKEKNAKGINLTLDFAVKVAKHYPEINFVFAHLGRLHWSLLEALTLENVWFDSSGLSMWKAWSQFIALEPLRIFQNSSAVKVIESIVDLGWEKKILFGSDEPYVSYSDEIGIILNSSIGDNAKRNIFFENAKKLLGEK